MRRNNAFPLNRQSCRESVLARIYKEILSWQIPIDQKAEPASCDLGGIPEIDSADAATTQKADAC